MNDNNDNDTNGWDEYRALFFADRESNTRRFDSIEGKLDDIATSLAEMKGRRSVGKWLGDLALPAGVAALIAWLTGQR